MGVLSRHIGSPEPFEIGEGENKDKIYLLPLGVEDLPLFFKAIKAFSGAKKDNPDELFKNMDDSSLEAIKQIIKKTLDKSLPNESADDKAVFGLKYMMQLFPKIMEINMSMEGSHETVKKRELFEKIQGK